ncbi:NUDIX hydrolase [Kosakonia cowanii]|uniref:NUDIX hydrolase n=1 Tax=Kosakonia cowanii TaxID=208223 RepID=UPI004063F85C
MDHDTMSRERYHLSIALFVLLLRKDDLLMLRRSQTGWMDGCYSLPAGGLELGETLAAAAARELREETGVKASAGDMQLAHTMHVWSEDRSWLGHYFICRQWHGTPSLAEPEKHSEMGWHNLAALPEQTIPYVRQALGAINAGQPYSEYGWESRK